MLEDMEIELKEIEESFNSVVKFSTEFSNLDAVASVSTIIFIEISQCECSEIAVLRY